MKGLNKLWPSHKDYSFLHTFGDLPHPQGLPENFSIWDGRVIANQLYHDFRFNPPVRPLPLGCTAETMTQIAGLEQSTISHAHNAEIFKARVYTAIAIFTFLIGSILVPLAIAYFNKQ